MKKIGVFLDAEPYMGGAFQYNQAVIEALNSLPKNEFKIIVLYRNKVWGDYLKNYNIEGKYIIYKRWNNIFDSVVLRLLRFLEIDISLVKKYYSKLNMLSRQIDKMKLDLIIAPSQEILPAQISTKSIATIHDLMHRYENFPEIRANGEYRRREYRYRNICLAASGILVDSELGKNQVIESYGKQYENIIHVLPFTPPKYLLEKRGENSCQLNLPAKYVFYPAQFWQHKNHRNLILAVKKLKDSGIDIKLVLVGSKKNGYNEVVNLITLNNLEDNVKILGYVSNEEMVMLYKNARAMVMPSFFGPTNIPPLEAMALGCPVAVSNIYGMPKQVGEAGLKFNPSNVDEISGILKELWNNNILCQELIKKGFERVEYFSQKNFNEKFKAIIWKVLG